MGIEVLASGLGKIINAAILIYVMISFIIITYTGDRYIFIRKIMTTIIPGNPFV